MAFTIRAGIMRSQGGVKSVCSRLGLITMCRGARAISSARLYVGGLSYETDDNSLRESFSKHGEVSDSQVIVDRDTGRSRGFGFVTYTSTEDASSAIQALDGQLLNGRTVRVNFANERTRGGGGGGYGGYGGGGGGYGGYGGGGGGVSYGGGGGRSYGGSGGRYGNRDSYGDDDNDGGRRRGGGRYGSRDSYDDGDSKRRSKGSKFGGKGDFESDDYDEDDDDDDDDDDDEGEAYSRKR